MVFFFPLSCGLCNIHWSMSVISRVKRFFANTISGYAKVMKERSVDWEMVSRRMMNDICLFNAEIHLWIQKVEERVHDISCTG